MLTKKLKRITEFGAIDKILEDGLAGKIKLYTKLKADVQLSINRIKHLPMNGGASRKIILEENIPYQHHISGETIELGFEAIEALNTYGGLSNEHLALVFQLDDSYELSSIKGIKPITFRDVYTEEPDSAWQASYIHLIALAIEELSKANKSTNAKHVHEWISSELKSNNSEFKTFLDGISAYDPTKKPNDKGYDSELSPYSQTYDENIVLKYNQSKPVNRKNFRNKVTYVNKTLKSSSSSSSSS
jgi:hypothetical protein